MSGSAPPSESTPRTVPVATLRKRDIMTQMYAEKDASIYDTFKDVFSETPTQADQKITWLTKLRGLLNKLEPENQKLARNHVGEQVWSELTAQHLDRIDWFDSVFKSTNCNSNRRQWVADLRHIVSLMTPSEMSQTRAKSRPEFWSELVFLGIRAVDGRKLSGDTVGHALVLEWDLFPTPMADPCDRCRELHLPCEVAYSAMTSSCRECLITGQQCASTLGKRKRADDDSPPHAAKRFETQSSMERRDVTLDDVVALLPLQEVLSLFNNVEKRFTDENAWVKGLMQLLLAMDRKQHAAAREKIGPDVWAKIVYQTLPLNTNGPYPFIDGKLYGATSIVDWDLVPVPSSTPCPHCAKRKIACLLTNANAMLCRACTFIRRGCELKRPHPERRSMRQAGLESDFQFDGIRQHMNIDVQVPPFAANVVALYKDTKARDNHPKWMCDLRNMLKGMDDATLNTLQDVIAPEHWTELVFAGIKDSIPEAKLDNKRVYITDWDLFPTKMSLACHNCVEKEVECQNRRRDNVGRHVKCRRCVMLGMRCSPSDEPRPTQDMSVENFIAVYYDKTKVQRLPDSEWIGELRDWAAKLDAQAHAKIKAAVTRGHWVQMVLLGLPGRKTVKLTSSVIYGKRSVYDWDLVPTAALKACDACTKRKTQCEYIVAGKKEKRPCRSCHLAKQDEECWESSLKPASKAKSQSPVKAQSLAEETPVQALPPPSEPLPIMETTGSISRAHSAHPEPSSLLQSSQVPTATASNDVLAQFTNLYETPPLEDPQRKAWYTALRDLVPKMSEHEEAQAKAIVSANDWSEMVALSIDYNAPLVGTMMARTNIKSWDLIPTEWEKKCPNCAPRGLPCHYPIKGSNRTVKCRRCRLAHRTCPGPRKRVAGNETDEDEEVDEEVDEEANKEHDEEEEQSSSSSSEDDELPSPPPPPRRRTIMMATRSTYGRRKPQAVQSHVNSSPSSERRMTRTASTGNEPLVALPMDPRKRLPNGVLPPKSPVKQGEKGKEVAVDLDNLENNANQTTERTDGLEFNSTLSTARSSGVPKATPSQVATSQDRTPSTSTQATAPARPRPESSPSREEYPEYRLPTPSPQRTIHRSLPPQIQSASSISMSGPPPTLQPPVPPPFSGSTAASPHSQAMDVDDSSFRVPDPPQWHSRPSSGQSSAFERQPSLFSERYMSPIASMAESRMLDRLERELDRKERDLERKEREVEKLHAAKDDWEVRERGLMEENRRFKEESEALRRRVKELEDLQDGARKEEDSLRDRLKVFLQLKE